MKKLMIVALAAIFTLGGSLAMAQGPQGGQGGKREMPSVEERVKQMAEKLKLSPEQVKAITKMEKERKMPERGNREAMQKMQEQEKAQMKKILDPKQYKAWEKMQSERRPQQGQGGGRPE